MSKKTYKRDYLLRRLLAFNSSMTLFASSLLAVLRELWERDFLRVLSPSPVALFAIAALYTITVVRAQRKLFYRPFLFYH